MPMNESALRQAMGNAGIDALIGTTYENVYYLSGLLSEAPAKLPAGFEPEDEPRPEQIAEWRRAACERAVHYLDHVLPALWPAARDEETRGFRWGSPLIDLVIKGCRAFRTPGVGKETGRV